VPDLAQHLTPSLRRLHGSGEDVAIYEHLAETSHISMGVEAADPAFAMLLCAHVFTLKQHGQHPDATVARR